MHSLAAYQFIAICGITFLIIVVNVEISEMKYFVFGSCRVCHCSIIKRSLKIIIISYSSWLAGENCSSISSSGLWDDCPRACGEDSPAYKVGLQGHHECVGQVGSCVALYHVLAGAFAVLKQHTICSKDSLCCLYSFSVF